MGAFEYTAVDRGGRQHKGVLEGDTPRQVRQLLRDRGLLPTQVNEVMERQRRSASSGKPGLSLRRGISAADLALVTRQLATLLRSGMPLEETLLAVGQQSEKPRLKSIILGVRSRVMEGHTLASGLGEFPQAFPEIYRATVAAGEQSGHLDPVLERLADYTESRQQLRQRISHALIYPVILVTLAIFIVSALLVYVVPKVVGVFENTGQELPGLTRAMIAGSDFLRDYGFVLLGVIALGLFIFSRLLRRLEFRRRWDRFLLRLPLVGRLTRGINTARFTRTLSILAGSGVPVLEALRISGDVVGNVPMREAIEETAVRVREGAPLGRSLGASRLFPPMTMHLISSGEASGELENMLERAADNQEREVDSLVGAMLSIMEPVLILFMGVIVLAIVLAILLPIFQLNQLVA
ncbi:type II secretion system inner membrane protein GspF [Thioalkalivibrio sp. XN279]|uniref:type II secretion system inner membrane protein GspF n=1 Tax=Thioalkalivibrio sp. XN279 TaxID=2714953 RepID=UPI0014074383|nr:type II secretion system inner membrane protein GspF [Thioalkalivibrio sp. XN279]NHA14314.1 type II secretion system inner membrane protein GspF [Thioalkalivibrio sp. XN279]